MSVPTGLTGTLQGLSHAVRGGLRAESQLDGMLRARQGANAYVNADASGASDSPRTGSGDAVPTLLVASGRGGSGTSMVAALIAVAAAGDGRRVLLVDGDDLVGPQAMLLGVRPSAGWQDLRGGRVAVSEVMTPVSSSLTLVAGGAMRHGVEGASPTPTAAERRACLRRVSGLHEGHDLVVIDCGSRLDTLLAAVAPQSRERLVAVTSGSDPIALASTFALCKVAHTRFAGLPIDIVVNRHDAVDGRKCFDTIEAGRRQFLPQCPLHFAGTVPLDSTLDAVIRAGMPFLDAAAGSPAAHAAHLLALRAFTASPLSRLGN